MAGILMEVNLFRFGIFSGLSYVIIKLFYSTYPMYLNVPLGKLICMISAWEAIDKLPSLFRSASQQYSARISIIRCFSRYIIVLKCNLLLLTPSDHLGIIEPLKSIT